MDSVDPAWPPGTRVLEFATDADELAALVAQWRAAHRPELRELLWYRVPVTTDIRNWRWATLSAVMAGRAPQHKLEVVKAGDNPIDLSIAGRSGAVAFLASSSIFIATRRIRPATGQAEVDRDLSAIVRSWPRSAGIFRIARSASY
jgi:hypothetical protein